MNNPNPFVPKGSILEAQSKRRSRLKLAVFCVLAVGIAGLAAMLIQGCKRETPTDTTDNSTPTIDTNTAVVADTNAAPVDTNPPVVTPPVVVVPPVAPAAMEYVVVKGDTLETIAKKNGVTLKALEDANPGVVPTRLHIGQKLQIPAATGNSSAPAVGTASADVGGETYSVKSGDTLTKIAKQYGTTVKALESENNLSTTKIKVGEKLKIPAKAEAPTAAVNAPPAIAPVPMVTSTNGQ